MRIHQEEIFGPVLCVVRAADYDLTEPGAGSDAAALTTRAVRDGEDWLLTGVKQFVSGAGASQLYLVMARTGGDGADGVSAFVVDKDDPGLSFGADERKMGWNAQPPARSSWTASASPPTGSSEPRARASASP